MHLDDTVPSGTDAQGDPIMPTDSINDTVTEVFPEKQLYPEVNPKKNYPLSPKRKVPHIVIDLTKSKINVASWILIGIVTLNIFRVLL